MLSSCAKPQANFYPLSKAAYELNFPFTVQVIPTKCVKEFSSNQQHKVTMLTQQVVSHSALITKRNAVTTSVVMSDQEVSVVSFNNRVIYNTVGDVIRGRKKEELEFLAVLSRCEYKGVVLDVGDVLHLQPVSTSLVMTLQRNSNRRLRCVALPGNRRLCLPDDLQIDLRKCNDVRDTIIRQLSDVVYAGGLPCLVSFPRAFDGFDECGYSLARESVLLTGKSVKSVVIGCHRQSESDEVDIHVFPADWTIDTELLHGVPPVAVFSPSDLQEISKQISRMEGITGEAHHKISVEELDLPEYEYILSTDDTYQNLHDDDDVDGYTKFKRMLSSNEDDNIYEDVGVLKQKAVDVNSTNKDIYRGYEIADEDCFSTSVVEPPIQAEKRKNKYESFDAAKAGEVLAEMAHQRRITQLRSSTESNEQNNNTPPPTTTASKENIEQKAGIRSQRN